MTDEIKAALRGPGIYRIYWKNDQRVSIAAIGINAHGHYWIAPTNWSTVPTDSWNEVRRVEWITNQSHENARMELEDKPAEEQLAVAVLRGDRGAAYALADEIMNTQQRSGVKIDPIIKAVAVNTNGLSAIFYADTRAIVEHGLQIDFDSVRGKFERWVNNPGTAMAVAGISRVELYRLQPCQTTTNQSNSSSPEPEPSPTTPT